MAEFSLASVQRPHPVTLLLAWQLKIHASMVHTTPDEHIITNSYIYVNEQSHLAQCVQPNACHIACARRTDGLSALFYLTNL